MRLPNYENAVVPAEKLRDYLLSSSHPVGRFKATFFRRLGYKAEEWRRIETDIRLLLTNEAVTRGKTPFGQKYEVKGIVRSPSGRNVEIVTIWIILAGEGQPRFVTAYPGDSS